MILFALLFVLFFVVFVVCGILVNVYLYANGAFGGKIKGGRKFHLGAVSLSQMATIPTADVAADLYSGKHERMSAHTYAFLLYNLGILVTLVVLIVLVLGATQF